MWFQRFVPQVRGVGWLPRSFVTLTSSDLITSETQWFGGGLCPKMEKQQKHLCLTRRRLRHSQEKLCIWVKRSKPLQFWIMPFSFFPPKYQKFNCVFWAYIPYSGFTIFFDNLSSVIETGWYTEKTLGSELILNLTLSLSLLTTEWLNVSEPQFPQFTKRNNDVRALQGYCFESSKIMT